VLVDTGNFSDVPTETGDIRTATLLQAMKKLGYQAINIGERDLTLGYDDFVKRTEKLGMTFLSTNIVKQGTKDPIFTPYTVVEVKGASGKPVRVGVLGVDRYNPVWQKAGPSGSNLALAAPIDMLGRYLPEVRAKADVIVVLAALSKDDAHDLAKKFPDIDLLIASYGGISSTVEEPEGRVRVYYSGNQGKHVGESRLTVDGNRRVSDVNSYQHFLTVKYPEDKGMADTIAAVIAKIGKSDEPGAKKPQATEPKPATAEPGAGGH
jgi:2',3'-cyclic-nucleotide 2'-phosphodiesterase (5'-nucleotidase family)